MKHTLLKAGLLFILSFNASSTFGQKLEEIVVTAQKRAESLQDVSVSVTAMSGEKLAETGVARLEEVTAFIPNFTLSETGIGTNIYIRGIGSGINQGFEQSVGMYFDGIYYGRAQLARSPIFDLERVEVLRGPQVTLFGNNSIGGAVSIVSAKPTDYFTGSIGLMADNDHGEEEIKVALSGPLTDNLNARLTIRDYKLGGYVENPFLGRDEPKRDYLTSRLSLEFTPDSGAFSTLLKLERSDFNVKGRQIVMVRDEPTNYWGLTSNALVRDSNFQKGPYTINCFDPITFAPDPSLCAGVPGYQPDDLVANAVHPIPNLNEIFTTGFDTRIGKGLIFQTVNGEDVIYQGYDKRGSNNDSSDNNIENATLTVDIPFENGDLKIVNGFLRYDYRDVCDCDFTSASLLEYESQEEYKQRSHEFRYTSGESITVPLSNLFGDGGFIKDVYIDYIFGGYYQKDKLDFSDFVILYPNSALQETLQFIFPNFDSANFVDVSVPRDFGIDSELMAFFIQTTINFTDTTRLMVGLRESKNNKSAYRKLSYKKADLVTLLPGDRLGGQYSVIENSFNLALNVNPHHSIGERQEKRTSWSAIIEQDITDDLMLYLSITNGFKGGGYDARSNNPANVLNLINETGSYINLETNAQTYVPQNFKSGTFEFEDEEALAYELGWKALIADRLEINGAYFHTDIKNLQLSVFDGGVGFNVSNAGSAVTQGIEVDWRFAITDSWMLTGSFGWLDFEFKDYKNGLCSASDKLAMANDLEPKACSPVSTPILGSIVEYDYNYRDMKGETNQYVSKYSGSISLQYERFFNPGLLLRSSVDANFNTSYHPTQNLDDELKQDGNQVYNLRVGISDIDGVWELALLGRNITDEKIISYANDVPLSTSLFGTKTSYGFLQRTKSWALQANYNF